MPWPLNNQIYWSDIHTHDKAGQQLRCKNGNDHKEHHGQQYLQLRVEHKGVGEEGKTFHGYGGSISNQIPGDQDKKYQILF